MHRAAVQSSQKRPIHIQRHTLPQGRIHWGYPQTPRFAATFTKRLNFLLRQLLQLGLDSALGFTCIGFTKSEMYLSFLQISECKGRISVNFFPLFFVSEHSIFNVTKIRCNQLTYSNNFKLKPQKEGYN